MKNLIIISLAVTTLCSCVQSSQKKAEETVKNYIIARNSKIDLKKNQFTDLDSDNIIGIVENKTIYDSQHLPKLIRTVYYSLNNNLTKVEVVYTRRVY